MDRGAGSVLSVAIVGAILAVVALAVPVSTVILAQRRAAGIADAAALSAADVAVGIIPGSPCLVAATVADGNGARLDRCEVDGAIVTVRIGIRAGGFDIDSTATAGPPGGGNPGTFGLPGLGSN